MTPPPPRLGLTLLQSFVECPERCLYRLEFVNGRFMYAVRVDTSHVQVATPPPHPGAGSWPRSGSGDVLRISL
jgi:hypothetical protein